MKYKTIHLKWIDSYATKGWNYIAGLSNPSLKDDIIESIGYLIHENKDFITISTSVSSHGNTMDPLTIPKCSIIKLKRIDIK